MIVSLICTTVRQSDKLYEFIDGLKNQTCANFELIIVAQGEDAIDRVGLYRDLPFAVEEIRVGRVGLSAARNIGIARAKGDIILFPDDDCFYPPQYILDVQSAFSVSDSDILIGNFYCPTLKKYYVPPARLAGNATTAMLFEIASSICIAARTSAVKRIGGFDERLGVGSPMRCYAAEDTEFLLRGQSMGLSISLTTEFLCYHSLEARPWSEYQVQRYKAQGAADIYLAVNYIGWLPALKKSLYYGAGFFFNLLRRKRSNMQIYALRIEGMCTILPRLLASRRT